MKKMTLRTLPALLLAAFSGVASAAAFQLWEQNASGIATAFAGSAAVADNASTNFYNPAGLTQLGGFQFSAGVTGSKSNSEFRNDGSLVAGNNGGNAGDTLLAPNAYFSVQLAKDWFLGFGVSTPFGLSTDYRDDWRGAALAQQSEIKTVNYNPSIAYRLNDKVSLGLGLNYQTLDVDFTNTTLNRFRADDNGWGWNAGALFTLSPAMKVGVSYRSAIDYTLEGSRSGIAGSAKADFKLPDTVILSVWQQVSDRWEAMGDLSYTNWSTVDQLRVQRAGGSDIENYNYKDSWRFAWGAAYKASDALKLKFGIAYDRTPTTNNNRQARTPDADRLWLSIGGQWQAGNLGKLDLGYAYQYARDSRIDQSAGALRGEYDNSAHLLGLQYSVGF